MGKPSDIPSSSHVLDLHRPDATPEVGGGQGSPGDDWVEKCAQDTAETAQPRICYRREAVTILGHGGSPRMDQVIEDWPMYRP